MPLDLLIQKYGYLALFIGTFLEGETILILAGFAVHRGYLDFDFVWLIAFFGAVLGDQVYFFIGRFRGQALIARYPKLERRVNRVLPYLEKYKNYVLIGFRFIYGFRTVTPFAIGISRIGARRFFLFNFVSGVVWALIFAAAGYLFGHAAEALFGQIEEYEEYIFIGIIVAGLLISLYHFLRKRSSEDPG
jgi:membrane protein DedA with SNARE-associated domain